MKKSLLVCIFHCLLLLNVSSLRSSYNNGYHASYDSDYHVEDSPVDDALGFNRVDPLHNTIYDKPTQDDSSHQPQQNPPVHKSFGECSHSPQNTNISIDQVEDPGQDEEIAEQYVEMATQDEEIAEQGEELALKRREIARLYVEMATQDTKIERQDKVITQQYLDLDLKRRIISTNNQDIRNLKGDIRNLKEDRHNLKGDNHDLKRGLEILLPFALSTTADPLLTPVLEQFVSKYIASALSTGAASAALETAKIYWYDDSPTKKDAVHAGTNAIIDGGLQYLGIQIVSVAASTINFVKKGSINVDTNNDKMLRIQKLAGMLLAATAGPILKEIATKETDKLL